MRPADRLFRIIQLMRSTGRAMTAAEIAARMEVAPRTIYRDMQHLIASGAPIDGERGVGYLLREEFDAPPLIFTFEQIEALSFGLRAVQMLGDARLGQAAREAFDKIASRLPDDHARRLRQAPIRALRSTLAAPPEELGVLRIAITENRLIEFGYTDASGSGSDRRVRPLGLCVFGQVWLLTAWCELRQAFRDFRLDRMASLIVLRDRFEQQPGKTFEDYAASF